MNTQARLGAFLLVALILLGIFSSKIGRFQWVEDKGNVIEAVFDDISGVDVQTPVLLAGVKVGYVKSIGLEDHMALVRMNIQTGIDLPASTRASISGGGLVGEKYVSLRALPQDTQPLTESRIPTDSGGDMSDMINRAAGLTSDIQRFFDKAEKTADLLSTMLNENRKDIRGSIQGFQKTGRGLASIVKDHRGDMDRLLTTLPDAAKSGEKFFNQSAEAMRDFHELIVDNRENLFRMLFELRKMSENLEELSDDLRRNPWKMMNKQPEKPRSKRAKQEKMEEMLMTTGRMGVTPARK